MNYVTHAQLLNDVMELERRLPRDISAVIGIPRSGMLPALIIAQHRNLPLGSIGFNGAKKLRSGSRLDKYEWDRDGRWLLIDDSIYKGTAMADARGTYREDYDDRDYVTAAVYGSPDTPAGMEADFIGRVVPGPRYFAWNLFHHADLANAMLDMDGVLCYDPPVHDDGVGGQYADWLPNAVPFNIPSVPVHSICTNRLRIWRGATIAWLDRHRVTAGELHMSPHDTPESRTAGKPHGEFKAETYRDSPCNLFIESDDSQARVIAYISGKPVIALDTGRAYGW